MTIFYIQKCSGKNTDFCLLNISQKNGDEKPIGEIEIVQVAQDEESEISTGNSKDCNGKREQKKMSVEVLFVF